MIRQYFKFVAYFYFLFVASAHAQQPDSGYPVPPISAGSWNAVAEDTSGGFAYLVKHYPLASHDQWEVYKINLASGANTVVATSALDGTTFSTPKILFRGNMLYWINGTDKQVVGFNLSTNTIAWTRPLDRIYDMAFSSTGDTLFVAGDFFQLGSQFNRSIGALNRFTGAVLPWDPSGGGVQDFGVVKCLQLYSNKLFVGGKFSVAGKNNLVQIDIASQGIQTWAPNPNDTVSDLQLAGNRLILGGSFTTVNAQARSFLAAYALPGLSLLSTAIFNATADNAVKQVEAYNGTLFFSGIFTNLCGQPRSHLGSFVLSSNALSSWNPGLLSSTSSLTRIRNRLYITEQGSWNMQVYCLPPPQPASFTTAPANVCAGQQGLVFSVSPALYAGTYNWTYSGTGASISGNGTSVSVSFSANATSGNLSAFPVADCGTTGVPRSTAVNVNPLPGALAGADDTLTCYQPSLVLSATSPASNVSFSWSGPANFSATGQTTSTPNHLPGDYSVQVTDIASGCSSFDTLHIAIDTVAPNVSLPAQPAYITCTAPALLDGNSTTGNVSITWRDVNDTGFTYHPDPYTTAALSNFYMIVQDLHNGCRDSLPFQTTDFRTPPDFLLLSHPLPIGVTPVDTITCAHTPVVLLGGSDTANTSFAWKALASGDTFPNPASLVAPGGYRFFITRSDNGCIDSSLLVFIAQDSTSPNLSLVTPNALLTCSNSTALLDAQSLNSNTTLAWTGPNSFSSADPALVSDTGWYAVTATWNSNGCSTTDSLHVGYLPLILVNAGNDTTVCPGAAVTLQATIAGNISNPFYNWSTGSTTSSTVVSVTDTTAFVVDISNSQGCSGSDTVIVIIPPPLHDSLAVFQACDGSNTGTIQAHFAGGVPPYQLSIDGGSFSGSTVFSNVPFGVHVITLRDMLGCTRTDTAEINAYSNLPQPLFLVASNTMLGDTIVLVDISNPRPDSVQWLLPPGAQIVGGTNFSPEILLPDTGNFFITLRAFFGSCVLDTTKLIHNGPVDTTFATAQNQNGIDSLALYPNPNNGQFTVTVDLFKKQNVLLQVFDGLTMLHFQQLIISSDHIVLPVGLPSALPDGTYLLRVVGEYDVRHLVFILHH